MTQIMQKRPRAQHKQTLQRNNGHTISKKTQCADKNPNQPEKRRDGHGNCACTTARINIMVCSKYAAMFWSATFSQLHFNHFLLPSLQVIHEEVTTRVQSTVALPNLHRIHLLVSPSQHRCCEAHTSSSPLPLGLQALPP